MSIQNLIGSSMRFSALALAAVVLTGYTFALPRTSSGYMEELSRHAERNRGLVVASGGPLISIRPANGGIVLRIATGNYAHLFEVSFPQAPEGLAIGREVNFVGLLQGAQASAEAYGGKVILIAGIALKPVGSPIILSGTHQPIADAWLKGDLDLSPGAQPLTVAPAPAPRPATSAATTAPTPAVLEAPGAPAPATKPSKAVRKMLQSYHELSDAEQADFLRRINGAH
jgi:hypothetical protein